MMRPAITMITNVQVEYCRDAYPAHRYLQRDHSDTAKGVASSLPLSAITFVAARDSLDIGLKECALACGRKAAEFISRQSRTHDAWLFLADGPWYTPSRITTHKRLWSRHKDVLESDGVGLLSDELEFNDRNLIRYAGVVQVSRLAFERSIEVVRNQHSCAIILSSREDFESLENVKAIFDLAFRQIHYKRGISVDWGRLASGLCPLGDVLMRVSGMFDDREAAIDIIWSPVSLFMDSSTI